MQAAIGMFLRHGARQPGWPRGAHDQHPECVRRADGQPLGHGVSFGAAPALIVYELGAARTWARRGWIAAFVYCSAAALRLARFNVNTGVVDKRFFQGLPSPAAAALVIGFIWVMDDVGLQGVSRACDVAGLGGLGGHAVRRA
jgi:phosphatidylserine synthase